MSPRYEFPGASFDTMLASPPDEPGPPPAWESDTAEQALEERDDEIARLHAHIDELETELEALRGHACERMTYGKLFAAALALLPDCSVHVSVGTMRTMHARSEPSLATAWRLWWRSPSASGADNGKHVTGATAEEALAALKEALVNVPVPATDPTGVDALVRDADVGF